MNINRYNYEEFFLLYVDNELDATSRKAVELFVKENPDLEEELVMIKQSTLKADHSLILDKSGLFKKEESGPVNHTNYEEFFVLYLDEELSTLDRRAVEDFVSKNPSMHAELELLMQTRTAADLSVSFPDKSLLYREERSEKPVVFLTFSLRVAIAAILLLAVGIFWLVNQEGAKVDPQVVVKAEKETGDRSQDTGVRSQEIGVKTEVSKTQQQDLAVKKQDAEIKSPSLLSGKKIQNQKSQIKNPKSEEPLIAKIETAEGVKNIDHSTVSDPSKTLTTNQTTSFNSDIVVNIVDHPATLVEAKSDITLAGTEQLEKDEVVIGPGIGTKNKLRGFFRKVTRVIGRTTNLPATENKSLLIGNFEIALK